MASTVTKRCPICTRFRKYDPDDSYCVECGHQGLESACTCGRVYDYELPQEGQQAHCPRCGRPFRGKLPEYDG